MTARTAIDPLWGYFVLTNDRFSDVDWTTLVDLYQPLVGSAATSLYQLLWQQQRTLVSERATHAQLLNLLDLDAQAFYKARIRLEAVALLRTYAHKDILGNYLLYELQRPLAPQTFFQDNILRTFLLEKIGQADFTELEQKYCSTRPIPAQAVEITKSFLEVFHLSTKALVQAPASSPSKASLTKAQPQYTAAQLQTFDWELLAQLMAKYQIDTQQLQQCQAELFNLHAFYGLTEFELAELLTNTLNVQTNQIDLPRLQRLAQQRYEDRVNLKNNALQETPIQDVPAEKLQGLKATEQQLVRRAEKLSPAEFLAQEKQKKGGFVGKSETRVLRDLQARAVFPLPVINILVACVLQQAATLTQALVEAIANDWLEQKITTAVAAVKYLQQPRTKKKQNRSRPFSGKKEVATDWQQQQAPTVDQQELAALQRKWAKLKNQSS
ncbi:DnaD domain protein [Lactobacillus sp. DCY120]|uniref:DnaD domain protein n=1 Tax=Bombilactobacillus apium TaxID=2675299 RepID=A0A850R856_9LACO|nr:DnaD domain protein [Bombilactobacillus apium]NVY96892.1 DnaD domain protein [Bombilactobacillus apium]